MTRVAGNLLKGVYAAVFDPAQFVAATERVADVGLRDAARELVRLGYIYLVNLALYAAPLTLAGFGVAAAPETPAWATAAIGPIAAALGIGTPDLWTFGYSFLQNSLFLLAATVLTLVTFHAGVALTRRSQGVLRTAYSVVYSTSAYLAAIFTVVWYLSTTPGVEAARTLVLNVQRAFVYLVIDALGSTLELPAGRPEALTAEALTPRGSTVLAVLLVLGGYYLYSLYLGSRINHGTDRTSALFVVGAVGVSPVVYVAVSVLVATGVGA